MPIHQQSQWLDRLNAYRLSAESDIHDPAPDLKLGPLESPFRIALLAESHPAPSLDDFKKLSPEVGLWWCRATPAQCPVAAHVDLNANGPLTPQSAYRAIETWTDAELSALHAYWWLAHPPRNDERIARLNRAIDWHLEYTQPDNATNRPWAVHVFVHRNTPEADHYAQTLIHNAQVSQFDQTTLGRLILTDAHRAIQSAVSPPTVSPPTVPGKSNQPAPSMKNTAREGIETYHNITETVGGLSYRFKDNLIQGIVILVGILLGAGIGFLVGSKGGALVGAFIGCLVTLFTSGIIIGILGWLRVFKRAKKIP